MPAKSVILLAGLPSAGCEWIMRAFTAHPRVTACDVPPSARTADLPPVTEDAPHLAIMADTGTPEHLATALETLHDAARAGIYTGLAILLQNPFHAFRDRPDAPASETAAEAFPSWAATQLEGLKLLSDQARAQHFRIATVEMFRARSASEIGRLMALIPEAKDPKTQTPVLRDPPAAIKGGDGLMAAVPRTPATRKMRGLNEIIRLRACVDPDRDVIDDISRSLM